MLKPILRLLSGLAFLALAAPVPAHATWYGENVEKGSDIMMMDVRWPWWPESTYYANWNFGTNPTGIGGYGGFTGGVSVLKPDHRPNLDPEVQAAYRPGSVWSFWGASKEGEPVRVAASSEYTYPRQYIGEGASGSLGGSVWPFIRQDRWYTMMMRVWEPVGVENPQYAYIGRWVKDVGDQQWHLYGIMRLPVPATSFTGNAGFLEDFGNGGRSVRSMYRRLGYARKDGQWLKTDTVTYDVPAKRGDLDTYWIVNILPEGDHELLAMELSGNRALLPQKLKGEPLELGKKHAFTVKQPDRPTLDRPEVKDVKAETTGRQVAVSWEIPASAAPQFSYRIEIFDNAACKGQPLAVREERMPTVRNALLDVVVAKPTVRLTITDVFDQAAPPVVLKAAKAAKPASVKMAQAAPGLEYELLFKDGRRHENVFFPPCDKAEQNRNETHHWLTLAELKDGRRVQSGISRGFDTELRGDRNTAYAFKFNGLLRVPAAGLYLLHMQGADGYRIALDGAVALTWDGPHGPAEKTAVLNLAKGDHPLAVEYFVDTASTPFFKLDWEGPGLARQEIPRGALLHAEAGQSPQAALAATGGTDGKATITVKIDPKGHQLVKTRLFLGKLQIAEADGPELTYAGPMPAGENPVWVRLVYDQDHTLDSEPLPVAVTGPAVQGWNFAVVGEAKSLRGVWQTAPDAFSFFGEGEYVISRKIKGDFTLTCRVDAYAGAKNEPVNALSWVGLTVREDGSKNNYGWGREFGIMQTGHYGLRTTANFSDLGGGRVNDHKLAKNHPWLRVVRQGNVWTAWSSADGTVWEHGATHFIPTRPEMDAGLVFRALPQDARAYFQATASHLTLEPGVAKDIVMPMPVAAKNTAGPRLTGVVLAPSDPNIVVARSSSLGLLRSVNGGQDWAPANGALAGAANCVRSVAIHPTDPQTMLRAAGQVGPNGVFEGGLWLTRDGGQAWEKLDFPGDFDGEGPSALCGEVVAIDQVTPTLFWAGCETKGFFRSEDSGKTWKRIGAEGERITAIAVNRWLRGNNNQSYLQVVTCPDSWMPLLGRGQPALSASVKVSRDYLSRDGGLSLQRACERTDLGYLNVAFDKGAYPEELPYATTHGVLKALGAGERTYLFPPIKNLECFRPVTALGCSGIDDGRMGRCLTQALDPAKPGQLSRSEFCAWSWNWISLAGERPAGGLISVCGEFKQGKLWWLLATDGLYRSTDSGTTLKKILDEKGK
jgi:hypothetical protein